MSRLKTPQARAAVRSLLARGTLALLAYTAVFALLAATAFPALYQKLAYAYADVVAPWHYVEQAEYNQLMELSWGFSESGANGSGGDQVDSSVTEGAIQDGSADGEEAAQADSAGTEDDGASASDAEGDTQADSTGAEGVDQAGSVNTEGDDVSASGTESDDVLALDAEDGNRSAADTYAATDFWYLVSDDGAFDLGFWSDGALFAVRDLSGYHAFLQAGDAVAVAFYFLGALAICLVLLRRTVKLLDSLAAAVSGLFADRFAPVELPDSLAVARAELVQIQNRALSDERAAKAAEVRKNELVAYLAHDMRTPLTSVIGYLSVLKESPSLPEADRERFAGIALDKAERLEVLTGEFFEITRYNLQAIPIERENVDLGLLLGQIADELFPEAKSRDVSIEVSVPERAAAFLDPEKMARAVSNVLRNAVAFARQGTAVELSAAVEQGRAAITVADTGKEISPEHLDAIFTKFFREDSARSSNQGGAGLGLAIAKEIVEAHNGTITAESKLGRTVFTIELPAEVPNAV